MSFSTFDPEAVELDTGIATSLGTRPSAFIPPVAAVPSPTTDYGLGSTPVVRPNTFDALVGTDTPDPGY